MSWGMRVSITREHHSIRIVDQAQKEKTDLKEIAKFFVCSDKKYKRLQN